MLVTVKHIYRTNYSYTRGGSLASFSLIGELLGGNRRGTALYYPE